MEAFFAKGEGPAPGDDPLGLLSLFNSSLDDGVFEKAVALETLSLESVQKDLEQLGAVCGPPVAAPVVKEKLTEHMDEFRREETRKRWERARSSRTKLPVDLETALSPPPPLIRTVSLQSPAKIEPARTGHESRPRTLRRPDINSLLPPPTERESLGAVPRWLRRAQDTMAPENRPAIITAHRLYTYGDDLELQLQAKTEEEDIALKNDHHPREAVVDEEASRSVKKVSDDIASNNETDEESVVPAPTLIFDAIFESGNLLSATRVYRQEEDQRKEHDPPWIVDHEYDLQMHPDLKTAGNTQWFMFRLSRVMAKTTYRFNILNFAKSDSLYLDGMQPLAYSTKRAKDDGIGWYRVGRVLCYTRNSPEAHRQQISDMRRAGGKEENDDIDDGESSASGSAASEGGSDVDDEPDLASLAAQNTGDASSQATTTLTSQRPLSSTPLAAAARKAELSAALQERAALRLARKAARGSGTYTLSFDCEFEKDDDVVYLAYSHPYTYSDLQRFLAELMANEKAQHTISRKVLCSTIAGNRCDLLTITAPPYVKPSAYDDSKEAMNAAQEQQQRRLVVLSSRVHPGESNASWIMHGVLEFLASIHPAAVVLRKHFVFKIVPMLNPDGVINGNYRCSLSGKDLNRSWHAPRRDVHPTVSALKHLIQAYQSRDESRVALYCDMHGHSRAQGLFLYGILGDSDKALATRRGSDGDLCDADYDDDDPKKKFCLPSTRSRSLDSGDMMSSKKRKKKKKKAALEKSDFDDENTLKNNDEQDHESDDSDDDKKKTKRRPTRRLRAGDPRLFPVMLAKRTVGMFTKKSTSFKLGRGKSCTARAVVCRELGVRRSYTLESSFCGGVSGIYEKHQFTSSDLVQMGRQFCLALVDFFGLNDEVLTVLKLSRGLAAAADSRTTGDEAALVRGLEKAKSCRGAGRIRRAASGETKKQLPPKKPAARPSTSTRRRSGACLTEGPVVPAGDDEETLPPSSTHVDDDSRGNINRRRSSSIAPSGLDLSVFDAIAREADELLRETEGFQHEVPDLLSAIRGLTDAEPPPEEQKQTPLEEESTTESLPKVAVVGADNDDAEAAGPAPAANNNEPSRAEQPTPPPTAARPSHPQRARSSSLKHRQSKPKSASRKHSKS